MFKFILTFLHAVAFLFLFWFVFSMFTSGVKAVSGSCGDEYPIEAVFEANWMCSDLYMENKDFEDDTLDFSLPEKGNMKSKDLVF